MIVWQVALFLDANFEGQCGKQNFYHSPREIDSFV